MSGRGLGEEIVDAGLGRDRGRGGHRVVAGEYDGADALTAKRSRMLPLMMSLR